MNAVAQQEKRQEIPATFVSPEVNIYQSKEGYVLEAEMPGVTKDGLKITLEGNEITILGHKKPETVKAEVLYRESRPVDYRRVFELDPAIDTSKLSAKMEQGVLILHLPITEKVKPRKIAIS